jgi:hypothetical protein
MDETEIGEFAYDYVELSRDVVHGVEEPELQVLHGKMSPDYEGKEDHDD